VFERLLSDAKLRKIRFHDLRHTFASLHLGSGESPVYVKDQIQVTVDIYGHLIVGGNRAAANKLDDYESITAGQAPLEPFICNGIRGENRVNFRT
jgi:integrase